MEQLLSLPGFGRSAASLLLAALIVMGSPGPSTMSATAVGAAFGLRRSLGYLAGLILGTTTVLLAVAAGVVSVLTSVPQAAPVLLAASAAYILYLAWKIATAPPLSEPDGQARAPRFPGGYLLAVANPKAYMAIAAVFAGTSFAAASPAVEAAIKLALLTAMIVLIHLVWLLVGSALARFLRNPAASRLVNRLFAAILVATTLLPLL